MASNNFNVAVLPTGASMNPARPQQDLYFDADQTAYILNKTSEARTRPTRVLTSFGATGWVIGSRLILRHDQTNAWLGEYEVVGIKDFASREQAGLVPDLRIKHCVVK